MATEVSMRHIATKKDITISSSAVVMGAGGIGFTTAELEAADFAELTVRNADICYAYGAAPVGGQDQLLTTSIARISWRGNELIQSLQFIRNASADAKVCISLHKWA